MKRYERFALVLVVCAAAAQAATTSTTLTVNANVALTNFAATGTATLTGIGTGGFAATVSVGATLTAPYTITLSNGTITGTLTLPPSILTGATSVSGGSATVTGGTGSFAGATGSFPSLSGSGSIGTSGISVTFTGAGSITTGGGTTPPPNTPTITQVVDAAAYGSSIAQGSIFIVKGTNLSPSGFTQFGFPLPATSGGVTVNFTAASGGTPTPAYLIYTYNQNNVNQIAAVLPSSLNPGSYNVTVTNGSNTSAAFAATVVARKFQIFTQDSTGGGLAVVQNFISAAQVDLNRLTTGSVSGITISPAKPGQTLIAWGTGMGPVTGGDNVASPSVNFAANGVNVQVIVGGMSIAPAYAGRVPGLAAEDQINFTLPANVPTGCNVSFQVSVNGTMSNATYISIAPSNAPTACVLPGFTTQQLQNLDQGGTYTAGGFAITQLAVSSVPVATVGGAFTQYTAFEIPTNPPVSAQVAVTAGCQVIQIASSGATSSTSGISLDAGAVALTGPSGSGLTNQALTETSNVYSLLIGSGLPGGVNASLVAGTYTLNGAGGKDVGKFTTSVTLGSPLTITGGLPNTVNRSAGLTINWTGGNSTDYVEIAGTGGISAGSGNSVSGTEFFCVTTAGPGTFTVPASILQQMPAGAGTLEVVSGVTPVNFSAPLTAGGTVNTAYFLALIGAAGQPNYQ